MTLPYGGKIWCGEAELQIFEVGFNQICDGFWYFEEVTCSQEDPMWFWPKCISEIKEDDM